jgi:hypothetical protein
MTPHKILTSLVLASGLVALSQGAEARIVCEGNFQIVNGLPVSTPYCREMTLGVVARSYGWRVSDDAIRYSESTKSQLCRAIGYDNRVQEVCAPYPTRAATGASTEPGIGRPLPRRPPVQPDRRSPFCTWAHRLGSTRNAFLPPMR